MSDNREGMTRRTVLRGGLRAAGVVALGGAGAAVALTRAGQGRETVWQIDTDQCTQCGKCATNCVLEVSAVRCVQKFRQCGYCDLCFGFFTKDLAGTSSGAESQLCPTGAIKRRSIEDPYFEYTVDEELCIGCAKCVEFCRAEGNGSLVLQVRHDRCLNCNECAIAAACPAQAFRRVPADGPYLLGEVKDHPA